MPWRRDSSHCAPPSIPSFEWTLPLPHFLSPLNFKTDGNEDDRTPPFNTVRPLGSSPGPIKGTPRAIATRLISHSPFYSPSRSICHRTELGPPPLCLIITQPRQASPPSSVPSVKFPVTSSCGRSSHGELWWCVVLPGELSGEPQPRPCPWSTVDHGATRSTDSWTQSTDFSIAKYFIFCYILRNLHRGPCVKL
jgi:hypothetical protein